MRSSRLRTFAHWVTKASCLVSHDVAVASRVEAPLKAEVRAARSALRRCCSWAAASLLAPASSSAVRNRPRVSWCWRRGLVKRSRTGHCQSTTACGSAYRWFVSCPTTVGIAPTVLTERNGAVFGGPVERRR